MTQAPVLQESEDSCRPSRAMSRAAPSGSIPPTVGNSTGVEGRVKGRGTHLAKLDYNSPFPCPMHIEKPPGFKILLTKATL